MHERFLVGRESLRAATELLHRVRRAHPTAGLLEAADLEWWWRAPRATDVLPQLFWVDDLGRPEAAVVATTWDGALTLDPIVMPHAAPAWIEHVIGRGTAHAGTLGLGAASIVIGRDDIVARSAAFAHGYTTEAEAQQTVVCSWAVAAARPPVGDLPAGYRLCRRVDMVHRPHHMIDRNGPELEDRLRQTSLYRHDLDLVVLDDRDRVAAYGLFWADPETAVGLVEPMRTEDAHRRRGLARHLLTAGMDLLTEAGVERIKVCFAPTNGAARALYAGVGFEPAGGTVVLSAAENRPDGSR